MAIDITKLTDEDRKMLDGYIDLVTNKNIEKEEKFGGSSPIRGRIDEYKQELLEKVLQAGTIEGVIVIMMSQGKDGTVGANQVNTPIKGTGQQHG